MIVKIKLLVSMLILTLTGQAFSKVIDVNPKPKLGIKLNQIQNGISTVLGNYFDNQSKTLSGENDGTENFILDSMSNLINGGVVLELRNEVEVEEGDEEWTVNEYVCSLKLTFNSGVEREVTKSDIKCKLKAS